MAGINCHLQVVCNLVVYEKKVHHAFVINIRNNDIDVFLGPLIDDLELLFEERVETYGTCSLYVLLSYGR